MGTDYTAEFETVKSQYREMREAAPSVMQAFGKLHHAAMAPGTLDAKTKELIALGIGIAMRCEGCIMSHITGAYKTGATRAEIEEGIGVSVPWAAVPLRYTAAKRWMLRGSLNLKNNTVVFTADSRKGN